MNQSLKALQKKMRHSFFVFFLFISPLIQGQFLTNVSFHKEDISINEKPYKSISFGGKINLGKMEHPIAWTVSSFDSNNEVLLNGEEINNYVF
jgi:hypothetical protein